MRKQTVRTACSVAVVVFSIVLIVGGLALVLIPPSRSGPTGSPRRDAPVGAEIPDSRESQSADPLEVLPSLPVRSPTGSIVAGVVCLAQPRAEGHDPEADLVDRLARLLALRGHRVVTSGQPGAPQANARCQQVAAEAGAHLLLALRYDDAPAAAVEIESIEVVEEFDAGRPATPLSAVGRLGAEAASTVRQAVEERLTDRFGPGAGGTIEQRHSQCSADFPQRVPEIRLTVRSEAQGDGWLSKTDDRQRLAAAVLDGIERFFARLADRAVEANSASSRRDSSRPATHGEKASSTADR